MFSEDLGQILSRPLFQRIATYMCEDCRIGKDSGRLKLKLD